MELTSGIPQKRRLEKRHQGNTAKALVGYRICHCSAMQNSPTPTPDNPYKEARPSEEGAQ